MVTSQDLASFSRIPLKSSTVSSFSSAQMHLAMLHLAKIVSTSPPSHRKSRRWLVPSSCGEARLWSVANASLIAREKCGSLRGLSPTTATSIPSNQSGDPTGLQYSARLCRASPVDGLAYDTRSIPRSCPVCQSTTPISPLAFLYIEVCWQSSSHQEG